MPFLLFFWAAGSSLLFVLLLSPRVVLPQRIPVAAIALSRRCARRTHHLLPGDQRCVWHRHAELPGCRTASARWPGRVPLSARAVYAPLPAIPDVRVRGFADSLPTVTGLPFFVVMRIPQAAASVGVAVLVVLIRTKAQSGSGCHAGGAALCVVPAADAGDGVPRPVRCYLRVLCPARRLPACKCRGPDTIAAGPRSRWASRSCKSCGQSSSRRCWWRTSRKCAAVFDTRASPRRRVVLHRRVPDRLREFVRTHRGPGPAV